MTKHYVFFVRNTLPQSNSAALVQIVELANAAANLNYSTVLVYLQKGAAAFNPVNWINPFRPRQPEENLIKFYNIQEKLKVVSLSMPWPIDRAKSKWINSSTIACKYYLPIHIFPGAKIVHTRDWNCVKAAIQHGVPAIYEHDHYEKKQYEPEIVHNPLFQVTVTVSEPVREDLIQNGMPPEKVIKLHNGFNNLFFVRQPEKAEEWRQKLLVDGRKHLVVYAGALYKFKGIDLLINVAKELPHIQFVLAGGPESQVQVYQQMALEKQVKNVTFLGYISHEKLASLLQAADVLTSPHCSGKAATITSPMKLFDYIAAGVPIVATEIPPLKEFRASNLVAYWCEPDNPTQFHQGIQYILETYPRQPEGYINKVDFIKQFSWENRILKTLDHIDHSLRPTPYVSSSIISHNKAIF
ncbi:MAG: glycosyltransferase [Xenococcaceae cyanobacterium]